VFKVVFKNNPAIILCFIINYLIFMRFSSILLHLPYTWLILRHRYSVEVIYILVICLALCPIGDLLLRIINDVRELATKAEISRLSPIFNEVYSRAKTRTPYIGNDIKLLILDDFMPSAFSFGRNTIVVSRGILETMSDEEIKGLLAHEFAHIANGNTIASMLVLFSSSILIFFLMVIRCFFTFVCNVLGASKLTSVFAILGKILVMIFDIAVALLSFLGIMIINANVRNNEYKADEYCYLLGYGQNMIDALYKLDMLNLAGKRNIYVMAKATHPKIPFRIAKLEYNLQQRR
jgi:Zn-dependent protease with chaperone function